MLMKTWCLVHDLSDPGLRGVSCCLVYRNGSILICCIQESAPYCYKDSRLKEGNEHL